MGWERSLGRWQYCPARARLPLALARTGERIGEVEGREAGENGVTHWNERGARREGKTRVTWWPLIGPREPRQCHAY